MEKHDGDSGSAAMTQGAEQHTASRHTPGPWIVEETRGRKRGPISMVMVVAEKGGMPGLIVNQGPVENRDRYNARLIAAAPDLLRVLDLFLRYQTDDEYQAEQDSKFAEQTAGNVTPMEWLEEEARAAIAKATGAA